MESRSVLPQDNQMSCHLGCSVGRPGLGEGRSLKGRVWTLSVPRSRSRVWESAVVGLKGKRWSPRACAWSRAGVECEVERGRWEEGVWRGPTPSPSYAQGRHVQNLWTRQAWELGTFGFPEVSLQLLGLEDVA